jgi:prepilin-type N-terminal cleavage/methylation domain-containing protein
MRRKSHFAGFTLIELMLAIVVMAILLAIAVPSFTSQFQKQRLKGAAERLVSEIQFARNEAVGSNNDIFVNVQSGGGTSWCFGVGTDSTCDCDAGTTGTNCQIDGEYRIVTADDYDGVTMVSVDTTIQFDTVRGLPGGAAPNFDFDGEDGNRVGVRVNQVGRVNICSPSGDKKVGEYPDC